MEIILKFIIYIVWLTFTSCLINNSIQYFKEKRYFLFGMCACMTFDMLLFEVRGVIYG